MNEQKFSGKNKVYSASRPTYPQVLIDFLFEKYNELVNIQYSEFQKIAFEDGFSLGVKLTYEALNH